MKTKILMSSMVLSLTLASGTTLAAEAHSLRPRLRAGQQWSSTAETLMRVTGFESPFGDAPMSGTASFIESKTPVSATVVAVDAAGLPTTMDLVFGKGEMKSQQPGAVRPRTVKHPFTNVKARVTRTIDPGTREEKFDVQSQGIVLTPDQEKSLEAQLVSIMPADPVKVGDTWDSERVDTIFGGSTTGRLSLRLTEVRPGGPGGDLGIVRIEGEATQQLAGRAGPGGVLTPMASLDITYTFSGEMRVSLTDGLIEGMDLGGPTRLEHGGEMGQPLVQIGSWTLTARTTRAPGVTPVVAGGGADQARRGEEPVVTASAPPAPAKSPPARPVRANERREEPAAGSFASSRGHFQITIPPGWDVKEIPGKGGVSFTSRSTGAWVEVVVVPAGGAKSADAFWKDTARDALLEGQQVDIGEEASRPVGGQPGIAVAYRTRPATSLERPMKCLYAAALSGDQAVVLTAKVKEDAFEGAAAELREIRRSLEVHQPPLKIEVRAGSLQEW